MRNDIPLRHKHQLTPKQKLKSEDIKQRELLKEDGPKCGCGRSPNGYCIGWHNLTEDDFKQKLAEHQLKEQAKD
jgi:CDGSH-type Zn-finger protein